MQSSNLRSDGRDQREANGVRWAERSISGLRSPDDAPKADMTGRGIDRLGMACRRSIASAVVGRAEMGAAFQYLARDADGGLARVVARFHRAAARILRHTAGLAGIAFVPRRIPVGRPLPDIADHVVDAIGVGREGADRRGARPAIGSQILVWEGA